MQNTNKIIKKNQITPGYWLLDIYKNDLHHLWKQLACISQSVVIILDKLKNVKHQLKCFPILVIWFFFLSVLMTISNRNYS